MADEQYVEQIVPITGDANVRVRAYPNGDPGAMLWFERHWTTSSHAFTRAEAKALHQALGEVLAEVDDAC